MQIKAKEFRRIMADRGTSITDLSEKAGVSMSTISSFLHHGRNIRIATLGKIAKALDVDIYDIARED